MLSEEGDRSEVLAPSSVANTPVQRPNATKRRNNLPLNLAREQIPQQKDGTGEQIRLDFQKFLSEYKEDGSNSYCYIEQIKQFREHNNTTLFVDYGHLFQFEPEIAALVRDQYYRLEPYLRQAVQQMVAIHDRDYMTAGRNYAGEDVPLKEFWLSFYNFEQILMMRHIRAGGIGQLTSIKGTVTRTSEVRPELLYGSFKCSECGQYIHDVEQQFKYTEPSTCQNPVCGNRTEFVLDAEKCKFVDWQKIRLQESTDEVPSGAMPRSIDVILRNELVERGKAGDKVIVTGIPIVVPDVGQLFGVNAESRREIYGRGRDGFGSDGVTGLKALGVRDLTYKIAFLGLFIKPEVERDTLSALHDIEKDSGSIDPTAVLDSFTDEELERFREMRASPNLPRQLVQAIAPHIFGHEDIKKGLLFQLLGGVHKVTPEGINLRGDINICIVGDPSTAKSQFLKYISGFMPRAVYTSGKASSAAGLTASVMKDEDTGEFTIEAGALMLADNGICCIDEFDKMNLVDQVAIHEAMEQQTISISKAGIQATLNARTSILAAANPVRGRYDKKLSLRHNINMSPPIMSRFDLFFVVLDECDESTDYKIAQHIVDFHRFHGFEDEMEQRVVPDVSQLDLSNYLRYARAMRPKLTAGAREFLVQKYRQLRQEDSAGVDKSSYRITVRQLESMVRLSEAIAKMHLVEQITVAHVTEACKLLRTSIVTIEQDQVEFDDDDEEEVEQTLGNDQDQPIVASLEALNVGDNDGDAVMSDPPTQTTTQMDSQPSQKLQLVASEYNRITKMIITKIKTQEDINQTKGMRKSEILQWYVEEIEEQMSTQEDLKYHTRLFTLVLKRMMKKDGALLELQDFESLLEVDEDGNEITAVKSVDPLLTIQPNFYIDL